MNKYNLKSMSETIILNQKKLSKDEWKSIEQRLNEDELFILQMLMDGFTKPNLIINKNKSLIDYLKLNLSTNDNMSIHHYLYEKLIKTIFDNYFAEKNKKYKKQIQPNELDRIKQLFEIQNTKKLGKLKKADEIRLSQIDKNGIDIIKNKNIFDYIFCELLIKGFDAYIDTNIQDISFAYYTIYKLQKMNVENINCIVLELCQQFSVLAEEKIILKNIFDNSVKIIGENPILINFTDKKLYEHQKQLFKIFNNNNDDNFNKSKLIFYVAPTGTGKTISPLGLTTPIQLDNGLEFSYKIIYCCVARHVGLAFAKSCISMGKKIAVAFGCIDANDIRLHFNARASYIEKEFENNGKTIKKKVINHLDGSNVQIIICDVMSYLIAMQYMLSFNENNAKEIIFYWDEPTITLDYDEHPLHPIIRNNWLQNVIPNVILSSATLPNKDDIQPFIGHFKTKFSNVRFQEIISHDFHHSISLIDSNKNILLPHILYQNSLEMWQSILFCINNKTLMRYFDLDEIIKFLCFLQNYLQQKIKIEQYFDEIDKLTIPNIKTYYLDCLASLDKTNWSEIYNAYQLRIRLQNTQTPTLQHLNCNRINSLTKAEDLLQQQNKTNSNNTLYRTLTTAQIPQQNPNINGIQFTTYDAHTLTDGPTYYFAEDTEKIANFLLHTAKIPNNVYDDIINQLEKNNEHLQKINELEKQIEDETDLSELNNKLTKKMSKIDEDNELLKGTTQNALFELEQLYIKLKTVSIAEKYIPNTQKHQALWNTTGTYMKESFVSNIINEDLQKVIATDVPNQIKILLMIGIGVFSENYSKKYLELMKEFANEQKLFLIIAKSDYIYGTNYSVCHGIFGKDLQNMTQQKLIQALGRIARINGGKHYTGRFRNSHLIYELFLPQISNIEANKMNELLVE